MKGRVLPWVGGVMAAAVMVVGLASCGGATGGAGEWQDLGGNTHYRAVVLPGGRVVDCLWAESLSCDWDGSEG